jgi:hypothetical protein
LENTPARVLERIDCRLDGWSVICNTIADSAEITHVNRTINQKAAPQLCKAGAARGKP